MNAPDPSVRPLLEAARNLLANPSHWCKGIQIRSKEGHPVGPWDSRGTQFSLDGALFRAGWIMRLQVAPAYHYLQLTVDKRGIVSVPTFNDALGTTHKAVIDLLNKAITQLGGEAIDPYAEIPDE